MKKLSIWVAMFIWSSFTPPGFVEAAQLYTFQGLVGGYANGFNDVGQIVLHTNEIVGSWYSYIYTPGQGYEFVVFGGIDDVNNAGQVVGVAGGLDAYIWSHDHGIRALPGIDGGGTASANKINNLGQIVGLAAPPSGSGRPVRWDGPDTVIDLTTLPGWNSSGVEGGNLTLINDSGLMAGTASVTDKGWREGALFDGNGWTFLGGLLAGSGESTPLALNNKGEVVGGSPTAPGNWYIHPFYWFGGKIRDLGLLPGFVAGEARGINDAGLIVGVCYKTIDAYGAYDPSAVMWNSNGIIELNTLVANPPDGMVLTEALAINNAGQILVKGSTSKANDIIIVLTPVRNRIIHIPLLLLD
jgi:probable HAF family extracellular repeat protein